MNRLMLIFIFLFGIMAVINAQTDSIPKPVWTHILVSSLTMTQVSYSDWAQGGEDALAYTVTIDGKSVEDLPKTNWSNSYTLAYGQTRLGSKGLRKTDDKIELESVLTYKLGSYVNPYGSVSFKSQFDDGYKYDDKLGTQSLISSSFDPVYITQSVGAGYQPLQQLKTRLGVAVREVYSNKFIYADNPKTPGIETSKIEGGMESVTDVEWKLDDNLLFTSKVEMFAPFKSLEVVVVRMNTVLSAKVSKYISVGFNVQLINDHDVTPRTQVKESLAMGITYNLL